MNQNQVNGINDFCLKEYNLLLTSACFKEKCKEKEIKKDHAIQTSGDLSQDNFCG